MEKTTKGRESPNWLELPEDVTAEILSKVGTIDVLSNVQRVCSSWRRICKDPFMWRTIDMYDLGKLYGKYSVLETICRLAVDRSNGRLVYISLRLFGTDHLLNYITHRCNRLRHFRLSCVLHISDKGLSEAISKLPLLEELEISFYINLSDIVYAREVHNESDMGVTEKALTAIGTSCPLLKSFKFNTLIFRPPYESPYMVCDKKALAIAKNMPGLRHLQLCGNELTNFGLEAILDGCPNLEYLDLRGCLFLDLEAWKKMSGTDQRFTIS